MSAATSLPPSLNDIVFHVLDPLEAVERDILLTRAEAWYPDLLDGLTTLYGDAAEEEALNLLALAARAYAERDYELRRLDLARTLDPAWVQHPGRVGYAAYTERFAGTLRTSCPCSPRAPVTPTAATRSPTTAPCART